MLSEDKIIQYLCGAAQALLTGEAKVVDNVLTLPEDYFSTAGGQAVQVDTESDPGFVVYRMVPYPPKEET